MPSNIENEETKDCVDLHISVPCELANRVHAFAEKNDTNVASILIEALDAFIRSRKTSGD